MDSKGSMASATGSPHPLDTGGGYSMINSPLIKGGMKILTLPKYFPECSGSRPGKSQWSSIVYPSSDAKFNRKDQPLGRGGIDPRINVKACPGCHTEYVTQSSMSCLTRAEWKFNPRDKRGSYGR